MVKTIRRALMRMRAIFRGHERADDDLRAEMEAHLEMETAEYVRRGMTPDDARRAALLSAGGLTQAREQTRDQRGLPWIENLAADARYAVRHFRRTPLSTLTMILVLSLGIGTSVVLFTVMNSLATQPPPGIASNEGLVRIRGTLTMQRIYGVHAREMSWSELEQYAARTELFGGVAASASRPAAITIGDRSATPITASIDYTTANYFGLLNVRPAIGTEPAVLPPVAPTRADSTVQKYSSGSMRRSFLTLTVMWSTTAPFGNATTLEMSV